MLKISHMEKVLEQKWKIKYLQATMKFKEASSNKTHK